MAAGIATGFVRKLYRILDQESGAIIAWDASGASFSIFDSDKLNELVLPRYFRGRLSAFRQQLVDHGFQQLECEDNESREAYAHPDFRRGCPGRLSSIVRVPKTKKKAKQQADVPMTAPSARSSSLKVTLTAVGGKKRAGPNSALPSPPKRLRADTGAPKNPLFSNDPDDGAFSIARLVEGSGLLPASSDLPDPISYLAKLNGGAQQSSLPSNGLTVGERLQQPAAFSDDLVRSALYFLVSSSVTGTETNGEGDKKAEEGESGKTQETMRSDLLASLLASSTSGVPSINGWGAATRATGASNPLFSDQSTGDEEDDENSIWNLLVASSVDRVKSAIGDVADPQEKLRIIIAERERLEEQRNKVGVPPPLPLVAVPKPPTRAASNESVKPTATNPLFVDDSGAKAEKTQASTTASRTAAMPSEDDLWRLLMSSSIDVFRALEQQDV